MSGELKAGEDHHPEKVCRNKRKLSSANNQEAKVIRVHSEHDAQSAMKEMQLDNETKPLPKVNEMLQVIHFVEDGESSVYLVPRVAMSTELLAKFKHYRNVSVEASDDDILNDVLDFISEALQFLETFDRSSRDSGTPVQQLGEIIVETFIIWDVAYRTADDISS